MSLEIIILAATAVVGAVAFIVGYLTLEGVL